jgi:hypothetical protein
MMRWFFRASMPCRRYAGVSPVVEVQREKNDRARLHLDQVDVHARSFASRVNLRERHRMISRHEKPLAGAEANA